MILIFPVHHTFETVLLLQERYVTQTETPQRPLVFTETSLISKMTPLLRDDKTHKNVG